MARKADIAWPRIFVVSIVGLDDTDSRSRGMCTTYVATRVAQRLRNAGRLVGQPRLVRLNPAVEYKTRGNAALAVPTTAPPVEAFEIARDTLETLALAEEPRTSPGVVVATVDAREAETASSPETLDRDASETTESDEIPADVVQFAHRALREKLTLEKTLATIERHDWYHAGYPTSRLGESRGGRGRIGGLAAIGAIAAFDDWTYEHISYRYPQRRGTPDRSTTTRCIRPQSGDIQRSGTPSTTARVKPSVCPLHLARFCTGFEATTQRPVAPWPGRSCQSRSSGR
jgi:tRNA(Ile2) 2-agmatinylcytidine synthetase